MIEKVASLFLFVIDLQVWRGILQLTCIRPSPYKSISSAISKTRTLNSALLLSSPISTTFQVTLEILIDCDGLIIVGSSFPLLTGRVDGNYTMVLPF